MKYLWFYAGINQGIATIVIICYDFTIAGQDRGITKLNSNRLDIAIMNYMRPLILNTLKKLIQSPENRSSAL